ncbi:MAG: hypothetical protein M2R46_01616 [Verrucomicrobia subdivision 3 bacterium]|nr:hypothetical protein [Limisphaerales bacterium]
MKFSKRHFFLISLVPVLILGCFFLLPQTQSLFQSKEEREAIAKRKDRQDKTLNAWKSKDYIEIEHSGTFEAEVQKAVQQHEVTRLLTTTRRRALTTAIIQLIYAHHEGTWESFSSFRIPITSKQVQFNVNLIRDYASRLNQFGKETNPSSLMKLYETYWKKWVKVAEFVEEGLEGVPVYCTQCWKAISLETLQLNLHRTPEGPLSIKSYVGTNVFGGKSPRPSLTFQPTIDELIEKKQPIINLHISFLVRVKHLENPHPIHVSYYWSSLHKKWLPIEFVAGGIAGAPIEYFF